MMFSDQSEFVSSVPCLNVMKQAHWIAHHFSEVSVQSTISHYEYWYLRCCCMIAGDKVLIFNCGHYILIVLALQFKLFVLI